MEPSSPPDYAAVCRYVGQLFIETRHQLENQALRATKAEQERDQALRLLQETHGKAKS